MQHVENDLDITLEKLTSTTTKLDEKDKAFALPRARSRPFTGRLSSSRMRW